MSNSIWLSEYLIGHVRYPASRFAPFVHEKENWPKKNSKWVTLPEHSWIIKFFLSTAAAALHSGRTLAGYDAQCQLRDVKNRHLDPSLS